jgi:hypothetical protein
MSRRGVNWGKRRMKDVIRRQGSESKRGEVPFMAPLLPGKSRRRPRPSKDELRGEAVRAFMEWRAKRAAKVDA